MPSTKLFPPTNPVDFLSAGQFVGYHHPQIIELSHQLGIHERDEENYARTAYEWVRDTIRHSWDFNDDTVSISASDALINGTGLCYAKASLLAALLRLRQIPTGLCYQRLTSGEGHVVHGLVAVWLRGQWHRQDPRGNTNGTSAEFNLEREQLAYETDENAGEIDYPALFSEPAPEVVNSLQQALTIPQAKLPESLPIRTTPRDLDE